EAFSSARIANARFEDERSTIAIAKPNELTAHVQDLKQTTRGRGDKPNRILLVTIHHLIYPITVEVLNQIFTPHGYVEKVIIFQKSSHVQALIQFQSRQNAIEFREGDMVDALSRVLEQKSSEKEVDSGSKRRDYALFRASLSAFLNPGPGSFAHRRIWDPEINISSIQHLEGKVVVKEWGMIHTRDQNARYALSKLLQRGRVAEYEREAFFKARITEARFEDENNQAVDINIGDPDVKDKQEVKKDDDQEIENIKDKEDKIVEDQQVSEADDDTNNDNFGCSLPLHKGVDLTVEEVVFENIKSDLKKDEDGQGKKRIIKGLLHFLKLVPTKSATLMMYLMMLVGLGIARLMANGSLLGELRMVGIYLMSWGPSYILNIQLKTFLNKVTTSMLTTTKSIKKKFKEEYGIPESRKFSKHHFEDKVVVKAWGMIHP
nr:polypyrimidine tract-binding protein homolog 3 isoform X2 [Tanacetum cinerariifolium]